MSFLVRFHMRREKELKWEMFGMFLSDICVTLLQSERWPKHCLMAWPRSERNDAALAWCRAEEVGRGEGSPYGTDSCVHLPYCWRILLDDLVTPLTAARNSLQHKKQFSHFLRSKNSACVLCLNMCVGTCKCLDSGVRICAIKWFFFSFFMKRREHEGMT